MLIEVAKKLANEMRANAPHPFFQKFLSSCDKAVDCIHEVNNFINRSLKDSDYKLSLRKTINLITNMDPSDKLSLETKYGRLRLEGKMLFRRETSRTFTGNGYVMFFDSSVLFFEIENTVRDRMKNWFGTPSSNDTTSHTYRYVCTIPITKNMDIQEVKVANGFVLTISNLRNFVPNPNESFSVRLKEERAFDELKLKVKKLVENAAPKPTDDHHNHDFKTFIKHHEVDIDQSIFIVSTKIINANLDW